METEEDLEESDSLEDELIDDDVELLDLNEDVEVA